MIPTRTRKTAGITTDAIMSIIIIRTIGAIILRVTTATICSSPGAGKMNTAFAAMIMYVDAGRQVNTDDEYEIKKLTVDRGGN